MVKIPLVSSCMFPWLCVPHQVLRSSPRTFTYFKAWLNTLKSCEVFHFIEGKLLWRKELLEVTQLVLEEWSFRVNTRLWGYRKTGGKNPKTQKLVILKCFPNFNLAKWPIWISKYDWNSLPVTLKYLTLCLK